MSNFRPIPGTGSGREENRTTAGIRLSAARRWLLSSLQVWSEPDSQAPADGRLAFDRIEQARVFAAVAQRIGSARKAEITVGRYRIRQRIGEGGMGIVYLADDPELDRPVVIKVLRPSIGRGSDTLILREARAIATLDHPNVVKIFDLGRFDPRTLMQEWDASGSTGVKERSRVFLAMEYVRGGTLADWLQERRSFDQILSAFIQAGNGLAAGHARGVVHRDFKPDNVLLGGAVSRRGVPRRVRVADFGLARAVTRARAASTLPEVLARSAPGDESDPSGVAGTPRYMAPEQMRGDPVGAGADQYAFCLALLEALGAEFPFLHGSWEDLLRAKLEGAYRIPAELPPSIAEALRRGLQGNPAERFPSMVALLRRLKLQRARHSKRALVLAGLVSVAGFTAAAAASRSADTCALTNIAAEETIWHDAARERVRAAFAVADPDVSQDRAATFDTNLETYFGAWDEASAMACRARPRTGPIRCLEQQLRVIDQLVRQTSHAGGGPQIVHAVEASAALPTPSTCVSTPSSSPPPRNRAGEHLLAQIEAATLLDDRPQILSKATDAVALARRTGDDHLLAEALRRLGSIRAIEEQTSAAGPALMESFQVAASLQWDEGAADAALALMQLHTYVGDRRNAQVWERQATALIGRLEAPALRAAKLQWYRGIGLQRAGTLSESEVALREALELYGQTPEIELAEIAVRSTLAVVLSGLDRIEESRVEDMKAVELGTQRLGAQHPTVAKLLAAQAGNKYFSHPDRAEEGRALLEQALAILERSYGPDHILVADATAELAFASAASGEPEVAVEHYRKALTTYAAIGRDAAESEAAAALGFAGALSNLERHDEAARAARRALDIAIERAGADSLQAAYAEGALARAFLGESRLEVAAAHADRALASLEGHLGPDHVDVGITLRTQGRIYAARGETSRARPALRRALAIYEDAFADSQYVVDVRTELQALNPLD